MPNLTALSDHLSPRQAAEVLGITIDYLRDLSNSGQIPAVITPVGRLYRQADVESLRARRDARGLHVGRPTTAERESRAITTRQRRSRR